MNPQEFVLVPPSKGYGYVEKSTLASAKNGVYHNNFFTKYKQLFQPKNNSSLAIDAFSPNLNKMLHVGHLRQYVTALFLNHFCGYKILCLLGTRLGVIPEARAKFDTLASKFSSYQVYLDTDWGYEYTFNPHGYHKIFNLRDGEGNYGNFMKVRNNSFETNSSSSHSLCLGSADYTNITVLGDTLDIFVSNEAGGDLKPSYLSALSEDDRIREKISYVISVIFRSIDYDWTIGDFDSPNNLFITLKKLIKEHVGVDLRVFVQSSPHQEGDDLMKFSSIGYLKGFIFRPDSYVEDSYNYE